MNTNNNSQLAEAKETVKQITPDAQFIFDGTNNENIFFNIVVKESQITDSQIVDLVETTRFETITSYFLGEDEDCTYTFKFKMQLRNN